MQTLFVLFRYNVFFFYIIAYYNVTITYYLIILDRLCYRDT